MRLQRLLGRIKALTTTASQTTDSVLVSVLIFPPWVSGPFLTCWHAVWGQSFRGGRQPCEGQRPISPSHLPVLGPTVSTAGDTEPSNWCAGNGVRARGGDDGAGSEKTRRTKEGSSSVAEEAGTCLQQRERHVQKQRGVPRPGATVDLQVWRGWGGGRGFGQLGGGGCFSPADCCLLWAQNSGAPKDTHCHAVPSTQLSFFIGKYIEALGK